VAAKQALRRQRPQRGRKVFLMGGTFLSPRAFT